MYLTSHAPVVSLVPDICSLDSSGNSPFDEPMAKKEGRRWGSDCEKHNAWCTEAVASGLLDRPSLVPLDLPELAVCIVL